MSAKTVKIESNGNPYSMRVTDIETGEDIPHVTSVKFSTDAGDRFPQAIITVALPVVDITADAEIKHVCPCCGREMEEVQG